MGPQMPYQMTPDGEIDREGRMAMRQLSDIVDYSQQLAQMLQDETQLEAWVQAKLTKAFESFGLSLLDETSNAPPLYNQWLSSPEKSTKEYRTKVRCALSAFIGGTRVSPQRWTNYMHAGICMRSLEYPAGK